MTTPFVAALFLDFAGFRSGARALGRWADAYFTRSGLEEAVRRAELWWRLRTDLQAAVELWIRLTNDLSDHAMLRDRCRGLFKEYPALALAIDHLEQRTRAELARLHETVQRVHGGWSAA